jgi:hypothetical protein
MSEGRKGKTFAFAMIEHAELEMLAKLLANFINFCIFWLLRFTESEPSRWKMLRKIVFKRNRFSDLLRFRFLERRRGEGKRVSANAVDGVEEFDMNKKWNLLEGESAELLQVTEPPQKFLW